MTWCDLTLGDALRVEHGFAFKSEFFQPEGQLLVVTPGNFLEPGGFRVRPGKERYYAGDFPERYLLKRDDLIIAMTEQGEGLLGSAARIPEDNGFLHNQRIGLVKILGPDQLNKRFAYWLFNSASVRAQIRGSASGTKVRHTAPERIYKVRVRVPCVEDQAQIASVLDAYNDLIENNRRRISLLEDSARLQYREWFVDLRFPGCSVAQSTLPEGWRVTTLGEVISLKYGKSLKDSDRIPGDVPVYGSSGIVGRHHTSLVQGPAIIVGRKGNVGSVYFSPSACFPIDTVYFVDGEQATFFNFMTLKAQKYVSSDTAVPGLNRSYAHSLPVVLPDDNLLRRFEAIAASTYKQVALLGQQTILLTEARNALLPKLMSGEIAV